MIRKSSGSHKKSNAVKLEDKIRKELEEHKESLGAVTFASAAVAYIEHYHPNLSEHTRRNYLMHLKTINARFKEMYVKDVTLKEAKSFYAFLRTELNKGERTCALCMRVLSSFQSFCVEREVIEHNPIVGRTIRLPATKVKTRAYSDKEKAALLCHADGYLRTAVMLALYAGMRKGEILRVHEEHVDLIKNEIMIPVTRNGKPRRVPLTRELATQIATQGFHPQTGWLFAHKDGTRIKGIKQALGTLLRNCDIQDANFHDLRCTCGSDLRAKGVAMETIKEILGHSSTTVTECVYAHA